MDLTHGELSYTKFREPEHLEAANRLRARTFIRSRDALVRAAGWRHIHGSTIEEIRDRQTRDTARSSNGQ